ncbi:MAG TPA: PVC-type heme-binding CxxCH protein [Pirellulales bacterium]|nr:PVC-type heme-binding CxxCH protein [Pirellulales bacterium]
MRLARFCFAAVLLCGGVSRAAEPVAGLRAPKGFEVCQYADETLSPDAIRMTVDRRGRIVVSGPGYIRILIDDDGDGRADRAEDFSSEPRGGAMGLLWEGDTLYYVGQGGLRRLRDADGDDHADGPSELIRAVKASGEHEAHALRRGPDGWLYLLCGNNAGIDASWAQLPTSPIREPVAGCVVRFTPEEQASEIVADGFRNAYGMDFNDEGELFTFDSDNERCVSLPWYEPTRFYHVVPGGHYGWLSPQRARFWRLPPYLPDVVAPAATLGRGSPTGVACYRHRQFPSRYRGGFFVLDWTFGRVEFLSLTRTGSTYQAKPETFLKSVGENGFAPTDVLVHPQTGDLYVSIGGRGTRGAVYRVRYEGSGFRVQDSVSVDETANGSPAPWTSLDWRPEAKRECLRDAAGDDAFVRRRALAYLLRHVHHFSPEEVRGVVTANWNSDDRMLRALTTELIASLDRRTQTQLLRRAEAPFERATTAMAMALNHSAAAATCVAAVIADAKAPADSRLAAVRVVQRVLRDVVAPRQRFAVDEGYTPGADLGGIHAAVTMPIRIAFPSGDADLDRELSRTLAMIEDRDPGVLLRTAERLTDDSDPLDDIHYLIVLARLTASRPVEVTTRTAAALVRLDRKLDARAARRDSHFPLRIAELHAELAQKDPRLNHDMLADREFGRPAHVLLTHAPGFDRRRAADLILARMAPGEDDDDEKFLLWTPTHVELLAELPRAWSLPTLRKLWGRAGLDDAVLELLARDPQIADQQRFIEGLASAQPATILQSLQALEKLAVADDDELLAVFRALHRLSDGKENEPLRGKLVAALRRISGLEEPPGDAHGWEEWLRNSRPELAAKLRGGGADAAAWSKRLAAIDWATGKAARGRGVFVQASCAACHSAGRALGPDLNGVAGRFSRDDLFTAIVQPSRDVSSRYRTVSVATATGKTFQGMIVYDAVDGLILQTGASTTVRIPGDDIVVRRPSAASLMPVGLLDKLSDAQIADLYAYLKTLR